MTQMTHRIYFSFKQIRNVCIGICAATLLLNPCHTFAQNSPLKLSSFWINMGQELPLATWSDKDLSKFKQIVRHEKDPINGKVTLWKGVLLASVVDALLQNMTLEHRSQIDIVVLVSSTGECATLPRSFINRFPLMLAHTWDQGESKTDARGPLLSVVPWTSVPKILKENLPLENFFVPRVHRIELTSYKERFHPYFLKRRTDPSAMRGEKLYLRNCASCRNDRPGAPGQIDAAVKARFTPKDWSFIERYLNAYQMENPVQPQLSSKTSIF